MTNGHGVHQKYIHNKHLYCRRGKDSGQIFVCITICTIMKRTSELLKEQ